MSGTYDAAEVANRAWDAQGDGFRMQKPSAIPGLIDQVRADDHVPYGPHLNMELFQSGIDQDTGRLTGRNRMLSNTHIPLGPTDP